MTLDDLHQRRFALETRKREIGRERDKLLAERNRIDAECIDRLEIGHYKQLQKRRFEIEAQLNDLDANSADLKVEYCNVAEQIRKMKAALLLESGDEPAPPAAVVSPTENFFVISALSALRQHYQTFSADASRVSTMRTMAAEFALKLDAIIKKHTRP